MDSKKKTQSKRFKKRQFQLGSEVEQALSEKQTSNRGGFRGRGRSRGTTQRRSKSQK